MLLLAATLGGIWYWQTGRFLVETDDAYVQGDITVLGPRIEADVAAIHVADNQVMQAGELLLTLDDCDTRRCPGDHRGDIPVAVQQKCAPRVSTGST